MVWIIAYVSSGVVEEVRWKKSRQKAKKEFKSMKRKTTEEYSAFMKKLEDLNEGDKVELYVKGGWIRDANVVEKEDSIRNDEGHLQYFRFRDKH